MKMTLVILGLALGSQLTLADADHLSVGPIAVQIMTADGVPVKGMAYHLDLSGYHNGLAWCSPGRYYGYPCIDWRVTNIQSRDFVTDANGRFTVPAFSVATNDSNWDNGLYHLRVESTGAVIIPACSSSKPTPFMTDWEDPSNGVMVGAMGAADIILDGMGTAVGDYAKDSLTDLPSHVELKMNVTEAQWLPILQQAQSSCH